MRKWLLCASVFLVACGPTVKIEDGPTSRTDVGGSGGMGVAGMGGAGGAGAGGMILPCVPPNAPPTFESMCGPPDRPCKILTHESLSVPAAFRNDAPSLVLNEICAPEILFSAAENTYLGFYARRDSSGGWSVLPTPFSHAAGGLVHSPSGLPLALSNDGAFGASLWGFFAEGWTHISDVPQKVTHGARSLAQSSTGTLYLGILTDSGSAQLGTFTDTWSLETLGATSTVVPVTISPENVPHVLFWRPVDNEWHLMWQTDATGAESLYSLGNNGPGSDQQRVALGVTAANALNPMGVPHVLSLRPLATGNSQLTYLTRIGQGQWVASAIETAPPSVKLWPLGVVTSPSGDVRLFYSRGSSSSDVDGQIVVAWRNANGIMETTNVLTGTNTIAASFQLDGVGHIHAALYPAVAGSSFGVRYVVWGN